MINSYIELLLKTKSLEDIDLEHIKFENIGIQSKDTLYLIYKRRSEISNIVPHELVERIKNFSNEEIVLTTVIHKNTEYLMFTNKELTKLIGIIGPLLPNTNDIFS